jgi:MYXO-CTERM domain-containing protein
MTIGARKSRWAPLAVALTAAALAVPAAASAADPGIDEYTLQGPDADNEGHQGSTQPQSRPQDLPPAVRKQLAQDADGETLAKIATARELGAPDGPARDSTGAGDSGDDDSSALAAAGNSLDDPAALGLIAAVVLIGLGAFALARRRRTSS